MNFSFNSWHSNGLSDIQKMSAGSLSDLIVIRDGQLFLHPLIFSCQSLGDFNDYLCTSLFIIYALFGSFVHFCHVCLHNILVRFMYLKYE